MTDQPRPPIDADPEEFRAAGYAMIDRITEYLRDLDSLPVLSGAAPGSIEERFAPTAPADGIGFDAILRDFDRSIMPGVTHWNHPAFFAYFAITGSQAGILGELLSAALNVNGMLWRTSPAATELETVTLKWLRELIDLPTEFFGIINDTASINTFLALAAAREKAAPGIRASGMSGRDLPRFRIYCSDQTHSSIDKAAIALGFGTDGVVRIPSTDCRLDVDELRATIERDRGDSIRPVAVIANFGTTSTGARDPLEAIADVTRDNKTWLHVDAAYGGSAAILPEFHEEWVAARRADSIVVNPHKWLFTPVDCSVLYTRNPALLRETFSLVPEYLRTSEERVTNYMDYGLQLGRRFRALKLWMVLAHYGVDRIRETIRGHIEMTKRLASALAERAEVEILSQPSLSVVVFRIVTHDASGLVDEQRSDVRTESLLEWMNRSGRVFVSHTKIDDRFGIRVAIGNARTTWPHVERIIDLVDRFLAQ